MDGCRAVVQLGDQVPGYPWEVQLRLRLIRLFYSLEVSLNLKIKNIWLILLSPETGHNKRFPCLIYFDRAHQPVPGLSKVS